MVDHLISISQGSAGVLEEGCKTVGFYTDKIESCRPYVFVCAKGTLMVHDTAQIQLDALGDFISQYGPIKAVHFTEGTQQQEDTHHKRLLKLAQRFGFRRAILRPVRAQSAGFNVTFSQAHGLRIVSPVSPDDLVIDPNHERREAVNILNDWFTPSASQSAPLDIQYKAGNFTSSPSTRLSLCEMLGQVRSDAQRNPQHGFVGVSALYHYAPLSGHKLSIPFMDFVKDNALEGVISGDVPSSYGTPEQCAQVMEKFTHLSNFG